MELLDQVYMNISALTIEEAEAILRVLEKAIRHYYGLYGVHRTVSFSKRGTMVTGPRLG